MPHIYILCTRPVRETFKNYFSPIYYYDARLGIYKCYKVVNTLFQIFEISQLNRYSLQWIHAYFFLHAIYCRARRNTINFKKYYMNFKIQI